MSAKVIQITDRVTCINDNGQSMCFLVVGNEKALLIDTANGVEDVSAICAEITKLPLYVVNTHGHLDHIYGNIFFDEAYMSPKDNEIAKAHFAIPEFTKLMFRDAADNMRKTPLKPAEFKPIDIGQVFDLGGATLEVVDLKGHTPGSVGLLCREERILFTGDGVNGHLWMQPDESLPVSELLATLETLKKEHGAEFDKVLHGHKDHALNAELLDKLIEGCKSLLAGDTANDTDYNWFGGVAKAHRFGTHEDGEPMVIIYRPEALR